LCERKGEVEDVKKRKGEVEDVKKRKGEKTKMR
jgi:hypothetical protein